MAVTRCVSPRCTLDDDGHAFAAWDLAIVSRGTLAMCNASRDGRRAIIDFTLPGELLHTGDRAASEGRRIAVSSDFSLCLIPRLEAVLDANDCRWLERRIRSDATAHVEELRDMVAALARLDPKERLAHLLLGLRTRLAPEGQTFDLPFSRGDIADLLGIRLETVSRALLALEEAELIRRRSTRAIEILDPARLMEAAWR